MIRERDIFPSETDLDNWYQEHEETREEREAIWMRFVAAQDER